MRYFLVGLVCSTFVFACADEEGAPLVSGVIVADTELPDLGEATAYVKLEDTSLADAPSVLVAEQIIESFDRYPIPFAVSGDFEIDEQARYSVRVLIDMDGDGKPSRNDYTSESSYEVITHGNPTTLSIRVVRIQ